MIKAGKWEEEATITAPECTVVTAPLTSHCCILDKLSLMVITSSHIQLSFLHNEAEIIVLSASFHLFTSSHSLPLLQPPSQETF